MNRQLWFVIIRRKHKLKLHIWFRGLFSCNIKGTEVMALQWLVHLLNFDIIHTYWYIYTIDIKFKAYKAVGSNYQGLRSD